MMHILIDGIHLVPEMKGVGRYVLNTLQVLVEKAPHNQYTVLMPAECAPGMPANAAAVHVNWWNHYWHTYVTLPRAVKRHNPDVVWIPYETGYRSFNTPTAMLVHDIPDAIRSAQAHAGKPETLIDRTRALVDRALLSHSLKQTDLVFANSTLVRDWLHAQIGIPAEKLRTAPCAPGADFASHSLTARAAGSPLPNTPYLLAIYTGDARENIDGIMNVMMAIQDIPLVLVLAGIRPHLTAEMTAKIRSCQLEERVIIQPFIPAGEEKTLAALYTHAEIYIDLSLHEGFGMQVIEAMACGTPVICSDRGALPEISGGCAVLVDPTNHLQTSTAIRELVSSQSARTRMDQCGKTQAATYTWEKTAGVILEGLELIAVKGAHHH